MNQLFLFGPLTGICFALNLLALGACLTLSALLPPSGGMIFCTIGAALATAGQIGFAHRRARAFDSCPATPPPAPVVTALAEQADDLPESAPLES